MHRGKVARPLTANGLWLRRMRFLRLHLFALIAGPSAMLLPSEPRQSPTTFVVRK